MQYKHIKIYRAISRCVALHRIASRPLSLSLSFPSHMKPKFWTRWQAPCSSPFTSKRGSLLGAAKVSITIANTNTHISNNNKRSEWAPRATPYNLSKKQSVRTSGQMGKKVSLLYRLAESSQTRGEGVSKIHLNLLIHPKLKAKLSRLNWMDG